ncbi:predicted nucleoside-diphosphate sugar epimerase [Hahella chejuensis KCTC 2396]|uniref:Predicted nucleoside-diphosphate sugar epimerase n=1 Tax=Hahella chejuensis (strain KCTC 2396) TaxID=349521 RepID=Q2SJ75_HAHCH|nr:NAD-dependent epimerase/dehydratase family protein [Hahella chejuensis]ABC29299.1 predicted nucleoside-diphosphate sugar epimerase [Hahella chejuensis KCTC 2396]
MDTIFIMGATGFIGEETARSHIAKGNKVLGLARSEASAAKLRSIGVTPVMGDVYRPEEWLPKLPKIDYAINVLGFFTDGMPARFSVSHAEKCCEKYTRWIKVTIDLARRKDIKAVVNVTGTTIFEDMGVDWVTEETPIRYTPSGFNRVATPATKLCQQAIAEGLPLIIAVAPSVVYGDKPTSSFDEVFVKPLEKGQMGVVGDGKNYITTGHVEDVGRAIAHITDVKYAGEFFHIADDQPVTQREFVTSIARALGKSRVMTMPRWLVAILGGKCAVEFMTLSQRISNAKLKSTGFTLKHPRFLDEVGDVVRSMRRARAGQKLQASPA